MYEDATFASQLQLHGDIKRLCKQRARRSETSQKRNCICARKGSVDSCLGSRLGMGFSVCSSARRGLADSGETDKQEAAQKNRCTVMVAAVAGAASSNSVDVRFVLALWSTESNSQGLFVELECLNAHFSLPNRTVANSLQSDGDWRDIAFFSFTQPVRRQNNLKNTERTGESNIKFTQRNFSHGPRN